MSNASNCCSAKLVPTGDLKTSTCQACGGLHGEMYRGEAYDFVNLHRKMQDDAPPERLRYFDLTLLGSKGIERVHGWMDRETQNVVQYG